MFKKRDDERTQAPIPMGFVAYTGDCFSRPQMRTIYLRVDRPARQATVRRRDRPGAPPAARVAAEHSLGHVHVVPLAAAAEVIDFPRAAAAERCGDTAAVVADVDPVANLHAIAVDGQGNVRQGIGDEQRDQLLGKLVRAVIVGAASDHGVHAVRVVSGTDQEIGPRLAGSIRAIRGQRCGLGKRRLGGFEGSVDLVGGDLNIAGSWPPWPHRGGTGFPGCLSARMAWHH